MISSPSPGPLPSESSTDNSLEILRRIYQTNREWYLVVENKTQLLIASNGIFLSVFLGVVFSSQTDLSELVTNFGPETWALAGLSFTSIVISIILGALSMWSYHNTGGMRSARWAGGSPRNLSSADIQKEWLWYYGYIARLDSDAVAEKLRALSVHDEKEILIKHISDLSRKIYQKFQFVNYGWLLTGVSLISLAMAALSVLVRS